MFKLRQREGRQGTKDVSYPNFIFLRCKLKGQRKSKKNVSDTSLVPCLMSILQQSQFENFSRDIVPLNSANLSNTTCMTHRKPSAQHCFVVGKTARFIRATLYDHPIEILALSLVTLTNYLAAEHCHKISSG